MNCFAEASGTDKLSGALMSILVFNAGSSSMKFGLFDGDARQALVSGEIDWPDGDRQRAKLVLRPCDADEVRSQVDVTDNHTVALCAIRALRASGCPWWERDPEQRFD